MKNSRLIISFISFSRRDKKIYEAASAIVEYARQKKDSYEEHV